MGLFTLFSRKSSNNNSMKSGEACGLNKQNTGYIKFDNLTFKLAVIEELAYEKKLIDVSWTKGDEYFIKYPDYASVEDEEAIKRLEEWQTEALKYFENFKIPSNLAVHIESVYLGEENGVYYDINPQYLDYDDYFENGKMFLIEDVSEEELSQFPNLKSFRFNMYDEPSIELKNKLEAHGYDVIL